MLVTATDPMGRTHNLVDANGEKIKFAICFDTETEIAEICVLDKEGNLPPLQGTIETRSVHLPGAILVPKVLPSKD